MLLINRIENNPVKSNSFIIHPEDDKHTIIIDPGSSDPTEIEHYIKYHGLHLELIILTHEHFDHIWSVEKLRNTFGCRLLASSECSNAIVNPKKNLSVFYDQVGFSCSKADLTFTTEIHDLIWHDQNIRLYKTPGHTNGSICILIGTSLFTGDTLLKNDKTVTKLPGGNIGNLKNSINLIYSLQSKFEMIYPGHDDEFTIKELNHIY